MSKFPALPGREGGGGGKGSLTAYNRSDLFAITLKNILKNILAAEEVEGNCQSQGSPALRVGTRRGGLCLSVTLSLHAWPGAFLLFYCNSIKDCVL